MGVDLLKHNQEAYEKVKSALTDGKKKIAVSHATGTGKSYLIAKLFEDYSNDKKLVLVPSTYISDQIKKLFEKYSIQNVDVILYQKLIKMNDMDIAVMDYDVVALDEYHHDAATKVWGSKVNTLIETHSETIFFGTSATPIKTDGVNAIDELFEGNCVSYLPLSESIAKKIVPLPKYVGALYTLDDELERLRKKVENATNTKEEKQEFYKKINAMRSQIEKSYGMPIILNKNIKDREGKYIVFCKNKKHLAEIKDTVVGWFRTAGCKNINAYVVHSSYENKDAEYKAFCNDTSHSLKLLFSIDVLNEGSHLENISGVLLLRPTRSRIVWHQQIGRAIEANNTNTPVIIDAVNNFSSAGQGMKLLDEIKEAVAKEKESNPDFDDSGFEDIDIFFVLEQVVEIQEMFKAIEGRLTGREWTEEENSILREYYSVEGTKVIDRLSGRTKRSIRMQAFKLGLKVYDNWSDEEIELLKKYYPIEGTKVADRLKGRTKQTIKTHARQLGIFINRLWTEEEIEILKKWYPDEGLKVQARLEGRTKIAIQTMAVRLNIQSPDRNWTDEETNILKEFYLIEGEKVKNRLVNRSQGAIKAQVEKLGIKRQRNWTDEEIEILKKHYSNQGVNIIKFLPNRSYDSIKTKAYKLGLIKEKYGIFTVEEDEIIKRYYPIEGSNVYKRLSNKSPKQCRGRANGLGITKKRKYKYVYKRKNKYVVEFTVNGKVKNFGTFDSEEEAAKVAREKAKEYGKAI